ncbi:hypothetical protein ACFLZL_04480 [Thermodesulfobacteriota bacterium]
MGKKTDRENQIESVIKYFKSNQWKRLVSFWQRQDISHMHVYIDTSIHPYESFQPLLERYLEMRGWPKDREMDRIASVSSQQPCVHNVHAHGLFAHIDFFIRFKPGVGIAPMTPIDGEYGRNLVTFSKEQLQTFVEQFEWKEKIDSEVENELKAYFDSDHWTEGMKIIRDPNMAHLHINIDTSIHPDIIREYAIKEIEKSGWNLQHAVHAIYEEDTGKYSPVSKKVHNGKTVFLCEKVFDIVWFYNKDVLISPKNSFPYQKNPIDPMLIEMLQPFEEQGIKLTADEIDRIVEEIRPFEIYAKDSWKKIPK